MKSLADIWKDGRAIEKAEIARLRAAGQARSQRQARVLPTASPVKKTAPPEAANDNTPGAPRRGKFTLTWFKDIAASKPKAHVIRGVFGCGEFSVLSGLPGSGKSVIVTDAACHVAAGMEWQGRKVQQGVVVYIAAERRELTERRMLAFRKKHGVGDLPLLVIGGRPDFTKSTVDADGLSAQILKAAAAVNMPVVWIVVDTLTRSFGSGDQNTSKDMNRFIMSCDSLCERTGAHVTVIHHTGHSGERAKGAIDLDGAVDSSFIVKKEQGGYTLTCDGTNDGDEGLICTFGMESIVVGVDEEGEETSAPVVTVPPGTLAGKLLDGLSRHEKNVLSALVEAIESDGIEPDGRHFPEGILVVTGDQWRDAYCATADEGSKRDTLLKRFNRAKNALLQKGAVKEAGQWCWSTV